MYANFQYNPTKQRKKSFHLTKFYIFGQAGFVPEITFMYQIIS